MLIATTATVGLLLVGVLALSMTPDRLGSPEETRLTTPGAVVSPAPGPVGAGPGGAPQSVADSVLRVVSSVLASTSVPEGDILASDPLALPVEAATTVPGPIATQDTTAPQSEPALGTEATEPPLTTTGETDTSPSSSAAAATTAAAFTTQAGDPVELNSGAADDAELGLPGENALIPPPVPPGPTTSSPAVGQSTTSTSSSTTSTSTSTTTSTTSTTTTTTPALLLPPKQLG